MEMAQEDLNGGSYVLLDGALGPYIETVHGAAGGREGAGTFRRMAGFRHDETRGGEKCGCA